MSSSPVTDRASSRGGSRSHPNANAIDPSAAIAPARSTDGSARVTTTNQPIRPSDAASRGIGRTRRSSGPAEASTKATFCPLTAVKWASPLTRNRSTMSLGWPASSPMIRPRASAASRPWSTDVASAMTPRTRFGGNGERPAVAPVPQTLVHELARRRAATPPVGPATHRARDARRATRRGRLRATSRRAGVRLARGPTSRIARPRSAPAPGSRHRPRAGRRRSSPSPRTRRGGREPGRGRRRRLASRRTPPAPPRRRRRSSDATPTRRTLRLPLLRPVSDATPPPRRPWPRGRPHPARRG